MHLSIFIVNSFTYRSFFGLNNMYVFLLDRKSVQSLFVHMLRNRKILVDCSSSAVISCIPEKRGYYGSCTVIVHVHVCVRRDFLVFNLQATFLFGFLLNFAMEEILPPYCFCNPGVKVKLLGVKTSKILTNFDYCLCSSCRAQFLSDLFYI